MLGCESNCLQTDLSLPLPFLLLFPITFYLCSCPYLLLALCFLHQLYCCCFLVFCEPHWQFRTSKSHDYFFHCLEKSNGKMAQAGWLKFSAAYKGKGTGRWFVKCIFLCSLLLDQSRYTVSAHTMLSWNNVPSYFSPSLVLIIPGGILYWELCDVPWTSLVP